MMLLVFGWLLAGCGETPVDETPEVQDQLSLADRQWSSGDIPRATATLEGVLESHGESFGANYRLGILTLEGDVTEAMGFLARAEALDPAHPGPVFFSAMALLPLSKFDEANERLERAYELGQARLGYSLAETTDVVRDALAALNKERFMDAVAGFEKATVDDPENAVLWFLRGRAHLSIRQAEDASHAVSVALDHAPDFPEALALRADVSLFWNEIEAAKTDLARAMELDPDLPYAHVVQGRVYLNQSEYRDAILQFWAALLEDPTVPDYHYLVGSTLLQASRSQGTLHLQHVEWSNSFLAKKFRRIGFVPR
jgi:tetratricopeptide (TPR) repeat protein